METFWIALSAALAIGVPALATAWAQGRIGPAAAASMADITKRGSFRDRLGALAGLLAKCAIAARIMPAETIAMLRLCSLL